MNSPQPLRYRYDVLIGGPLHGERRVIEDRADPYRVPTLGYSRNGYSEEVYRKHTFALTSADDPPEVVEFYAYGKLRSDQAMRYMWDELMRGMGARLLR